MSVYVRLYGVNEHLAITDALISSSVIAKD